MTACAWKQPDSCPNWTGGLPPRRCERSRATGASMTACGWKQPDSCPKFDRRAAAEALRAIARDGNVDDSLRMEAAEQLASLDPRAAV